MHVVTSTLISTWYCDLYLALAIASLNKKKKFLVCFVYLGKALFILAMQAQAHKCRNNNVFLYNNVVETCACAWVVIMPRKQKAA